MNELLKIILSLSLSGTILILFLLFLRPLYQNRLSKRWQYYIWLLVIVRLLLPLTPGTSVTGTLFRQAEMRITQSSGHASTHIDDNGLTHTDSVDTGSTDPLAQSAAADTDSAPIDKTQTPLTDDAVVSSQSMDAGTTPKPDPGTLSDTFVSRKAKDTLTALCTLWLIIALLLLVRKITIYQSFVKYVNAGSIPVDDIALLERFGQIIAEQKIHLTIDLRVNSLVSSPLLIGFLHTRIILPAADLPEEDFYYTVLHELTHYKRLDMFYKWLGQLTLCLHWFNPFVHLMVREINRLCELSCDERVISTYTETTRKSYGNTLLNAIGTGGTYKDTIASVTLHESKELLKGRLEAIMNYRKIPKWMQITAVFFTGILIGGAIVLGAYAAPGSGFSGPSNDPTPSSSQTLSDEDKSSSDDSAAMHTAGTTKRDMTNNASLPDYTIQYEDGIYYIMVDGTDEEDKPLSSVTNGYKQLVLVRKDYYAVFGTFDDHDMASLAKYIKGQCRTKLENDTITQENAYIITKAAQEIQDTYYSGEDDSVTLYNYTQSAYYQYPYLIEIGYNLSADAQEQYSARLLTLSNQRTMPVYFTAVSETFISDENAILAITALVERMVTKKADSSRPVEAPIIISMEYVGDTDINTLAERKYAEGVLTYFAALFLELDSQTQLEYLDRMFEENNISFFACCIGYLEDTTHPQDVVERYIRKAYEENRTNFFSVLAGMLDAASRETWREKAKKDGKSSYYYLLQDYDDIYNEDSFMDEESTLEDFMDEESVEILQDMDDDPVADADDAHSYPTNINKPEPAHKTGSL